MTFLPLAHHSLVLALPFAGPAILVTLAVGGITLRDRRRERREDRSEEVGQGPAERRYDGPAPT
jgi:hypothetical protein